MAIRFDNSRKFLLLAAFTCALMFSAAEDVRAQKKVEIVKVTLKPEKTEYANGCPVKIIFSGTITIKKAAGTGTVKYSFERSDGGKSSQMPEVHFGINETVKKIETSWTLGKSFNGWIFVKAYEPQSNKIFASSARDGSFSLRCADRAKP